MARYIIKRKTYSAIGNTLGGVVNGVGGAMNSTLGRGVGAYLGWKAAGSLLNTFVPGLGLLGRGAVKLGGALLGKSVMSGVGKGLKNTGQNMMYG